MGKQGYQGSRVAVPLQSMHCYAMYLQEGMCSECNGHLLALGMHSPLPGEKGYLKLALSWGAQGLYPMPSWAQHEHCQSPQQPMPQPCSGGNGQHDRDSGCYEVGGPPGRTHLETASTLQAPAPPDAAMLAAIAVDSIVLARPSHSLSGTIPQPHISSPLFPTSSCAWGSAPTAKSKAGCWQYPEPGDTTTHPTAHRAAVEWIEHSEESHPGLDMILCEPS